MNNDWQNNVALMVYIKQAIMKLDINNLWPHNLPEVAATEEELQKTEQHLGYSLESNYRGFLKAANGWKGFYQTVNLFGTNELLDSPIMEYAISMLEAIDNRVIQSIGFSREDLLPIAVTEYDKDLFVISSQNSKEPGIVIWFADEEIDRYPDFKEFYSAMLDYNREEVKDLEKRGRQ